MQHHQYWAIVISTASLCGSGTAIADINQPILPGADITSKDLPDGPKPLETLKGVGLGGVGDKVSSQISAGPCIHNSPSQVVLLNVSCSKFD